MKNVTVKIVTTGKHVHKGTCGSPKKCAIALAASEIFRDVHVGLNLRVWETKTFTPSTRSFELTKTAMKFISSFDGLQTKEQRKALAAKLDKTPLIVKATMTQDEAKKYLRPSVYKRVAA